MTTPGALGAITGPNQSPGFLLWRTTLRWQRAITRALRPVELTHVQFVLLTTVWWLSRRAGTAAQLPSQRDVADHADVDVMMTSQVLRVLDARGLVTRTADSGDARVKRLTVTDAGHRLAEQAITVVEAADATFFMPAKDPRLLLEVLRELAGTRGELS